MPVNFTYKLGCTFHEDGIGFALQSPLANQVIAGIDAACAAGFRRVKLNAVILKGRNDDEVVDLVNFARERDMDISFIEEMYSSGGK